jgi:hypothetical protein
MRTLVEYRFVLSLALSGIVGVVGLHVYPWPAENAILSLVRIERPIVYAGFTYTHATLWFSTPFFLSSIGFSLLYIFVARWDRKATEYPLPTYSAPELREDLFLVLGEQHYRTSPRRASMPSWLIIPERELYTGMAIVGAIGSGKTSSYMYPYVDQLLAYRASDPGRKIAGLVLEVKGHFCRQVRDILRRRGRADDHVEVSLESPYRYNPLHNDLDAYALAYGIATLMTNLFGRGKEPFWQQASTNLVKFVILFHQTVDDYVTLFQVYEHVINADKLRAKIAEATAAPQPTTGASSGGATFPGRGRPRIRWCQHASAQAVAAAAKAVGCRRARVGASTTAQRTALRSDADQRAQAVHVLWHQGRIRPDGF